MSEEKKLTNETVDLEDMAALNDAELDKIAGGRRPCPLLYVYMAKYVPQFKGNCVSAWEWGDSTNSRSYSDFEKYFPEEYARFRAEQS